MKPPDRPRFTARKLAALPESTRLRKILRLLDVWQSELRRGLPPDPQEYRGVWECLPEALAGGLSSTEREQTDPTVLLRGFNALSARIMEALGLTAADWSLASSPDDPEQKPDLFPGSAYLEDLRSPFNLGSIFRTAEAYGLRELILSPNCPPPDHPRARKTAMGTTEWIPWRTATLESLRETGKPVFALERGGTPVGEFVFPQDGICLLGSEELGLSPAALTLADAGAGRVSLPLYGRKASLNVGVAFGILLSHWR